MTAKGSRDAQPARNPRFVACRCLSVTGDPIDGSSPIMTNVDLHEEPVSGGSGSPGSSSTPTADPRRWQALGILALVQFIIFLDATIVNVALPSIQHDLGFSASGLTWVVNG